MINLVNKHNDIWEWHNVLDNPEELYSLLKNKEWEEYTNKLPTADRNINGYGGGEIIGKSTILFPLESSYKIIFDSFNKCFEDYNKENDLNLTFENISKDSFVFREYLPGSSMLGHGDVYSYVKKDDAMVIPLFTIILYINDDYEGGEINFIDDKLKIIPKAGSGIMFPSQKIHEVLEVKSGVRRMVQTYVNEHKRSYYDEDTVDSKYWYNVIMNTSPPPCFYCEKESKYSEPEKETGAPIDVCDTHFHFKYMG